MCATIADYGNGTDEVESREHRVGTIPYMSPEALLLKDKDAQEGDNGQLQEPKASKEPRLPAYNQKVDVYPLAVVGFKLFFKKRNHVNDPRIH